MTDRTAALARIAAKALSLSEHLANTPASESVDDSLSQARWEAWCKAAANGDAEQFTRRLRWSGLDAEVVRGRLGETGRMSTGDQMPTWTHTLDDVLTMAEALPRDQWPDSTVLLSGRHRPIPFQEVWHPFVMVAQRRLIDHPAATRLADAAWQALDQMLSVRLADIGGSAVALEFWVARVKQNPSLAFIGQAGLAQQASELPSSSVSRDAYLSFVGGLLGGGLLAFFEEYAALARLLITAMEQYIAFVTEFLTHLQDDSTAIQSQFNHVAGRVAALSPGLSDYHQHGKTVIAVRFESGLKVVYKPHDLGTEVAYHNLIGWLNNRGLRQPLKVLTILNRPTHGWVAHVDNVPCADQAAVERYFYRIGSLVGLLYVLSGTDFHYENLIACADQPVPIDLEVLLNPTIAADAESDDNAALFRMVNIELKSSVLYSGLLPFRQTAERHDISGLGRDTEQAFKKRVPVWYAINTDLMVLIHNEMTIRPGPTTSLPMLNGTLQSARNYLRPILDGFQEMYWLLLNERAELLANETSPLRAFLDVPLRFVFRSTNVYLQILHGSFDPKYARVGIDRSLRLELLARAYLNTSFEPIVWPILARELAAIERMDVPLFTVRANSTALMFEDGTMLPSFFVESGFEQLRSSLQRLNEADLGRQMIYIEATLLPKIGVSAHPTRSLTRHPVQPTTEISALLTPTDFAAEAIRLGEILKASALQTNGAANWVALDFQSEMATYVPGSLNNSLYSGLSGVTLFLAALARYTGGTDYHELITAAVKPIRWWLKQATPQEGLQIGIGGGSGLGSMVYGLSRIGQWLNDEQFVVLAEQIAALVTPDLITADQTLDVISGVAGAILGLLALYSIRPDAALLDKLVLCGQRLLATQTAGPNGQYAWITLDNAHLTGFSHGAAGISYALLQLYSLTGEGAFREAARRGIAYETSVFAPDTGNWPDFRAYSVENAPNRRAFMISWCHGAPGIGLARIGGLPTLDTDEIRYDIQVAMRTTQNAGLMDVDHVCCGNFGRVDILLTAAQRLSRPDLSSAAAVLASAVVRQAQTRGHYRLVGALTSPVVNPGFFNGIAGIGYSLLRLVDPERLPSVLLWD